MKCSKSQMHSKKRFSESLLIAIRGVFEATGSERNLKIQWFFGSMVVIAGVVFRLSPLEWCCLIICIGAVLSAELMNTAIESIVDLLQPEVHETARKAKDYAAASVLIMSLAAGAVGIIIFGKHLIEIIKELNAFQ